MSKQKIVSRRRFLKTSAAAGLALNTVRPVWAQAPSQTVRLAGIGIGGRGWTDISETAGHPDAKVVGVADVDSTAFAKIHENMGTRVKTFADWRMLFDKMGDDFDGVTIATPDHMHAPIALTAMRMGKHVYVEKPLCHTLHENKVLHEASKKHNVVCQMGNQAHSDEKHDRTKKLLRMGVLGKIQRLHAWSNRPIWPQGEGRPEGSDPIPNNLHWHEWLGVAEDRPYVNDHYHSFKWRGYWDFGTGAFGDMGCHIMDLQLDALELKQVLSAKATPLTPAQYMHPKAEVVVLTFKGTQYTEGDISLTWYDGGKRPNSTTEPLLKKLGRKVKMTENGRIIVGEKGIVVDQHYKGIQWFDLEGNEFEPPAIEASGVHHHQGWVSAILGRDVENNNRSNFDAACPLTEACLLGTLSARFPEQLLAWDQASLKITNHAEANKFVHKDYREGWEVEGL